MKDVFEKGTSLKPKNAHCHEYDKEQDFFDNKIEPDEM